MTSCGSVPTSNFRLVPLSAHLQFKVSLIWAKRVSALYRRLSLNVLREVCQYITFHPLLTKCRETELVVFDLVKEQLQVLKYEQFGSIPQFSESCQSVCIGAAQVFMCGGCTRSQEATPRAMVLSANQMIALPDMGTARYTHGLFYDEALRRVYAFGGAVNFLEDTRSCEEYDIAGSSWSPLPNMTQPNECIHTSGYQGKVFIGLFAHYEVYTIAKRQFERLSVPLCQGYISPIVWECQLIIFQGKKVLRLDVQSYAFISQTELRQDVYARGSLVFNDLLFTLSSGGVRVYHLETLEIVHLW